MVDPLLTLVIPTRHEEATVAAFVRRTFRAVDGIPTDMVVVDDSDHDGTVDVLHNLRKEMGERLTVLHRPKGSVPERTLGTAVVTGIRAARGTYVCVLDADTQHPPEAIPCLLEKAQQYQAGYVGASRYMPGGSAQGLDGVTRQAISIGLALLTRLVFLLMPIRGLTDPLTGFFLFRRSLVQSVELHPIGWKISLEVLVRSRVSRLAEVPYTFAQRDDGNSKATLEQGMLVLKHILVLLFSLRGFRRFLLFGAVGISGAAINTGTLLILARLGFDALSWPIWVATEIAILWNYHLNRRVTWRDRRCSQWWSYNLAAIGSSVSAICVTTILVDLAHLPLGLASVSGIGLGTILNFVVLDRFVFSRLHIGAHYEGASVFVTPRGRREDEIALSA